MLKKKTHSLKATIFGATAAVAFMISIIVAIIFVADHLHDIHTFEDTFIKDSVGSAAFLAHTVRPYLAKRNFPAMDDVLSYSAKRAYRVYVVVTDTEGRVVAHSGVEGIGDRFEIPVVDRVERIEGSLVQRYVLNGRKLIDISTPIKDGRRILGTLRLGLNTKWLEEETARLENTLLIFSLAFASAIALGMFLASVISRKIAEPILKLKEAAENVGKGDYSQPVDIKSNDEVEILADAFRKMMEDLHKSERQVYERTCDLKTSHDQLRDLAAHLQSVREEERTSIAREIHDQLGQVLVAMKIDLSWFRSRYSDHGAIFDKAGSMLNTIDELIRSVKRICTELRPSMLDDFGLVSAIQWQAGEFQKRSGIECSVVSESDDIKLDNARSVAFFRIFQEALTNILKHAEATKVTATLAEVNGNLILEVTDNGKGISSDQLCKPQSFGIIGMRERVYQWGGEIAIAAADGGGATLKASVPLKTGQGRGQG